MKPKKTRKSGIARNRVSRRAFSVATFADMERQDRTYWHRQTPEARLEAMEIMRRINYGKAAAGRLQRVLEVVQFAVR